MEVRRKVLAEIAELGVPTTAVVFSAQGKSGVDEARAAVAALLDGEAVAVPKEASEAMLGETTGLDADDWNDDPITCTAIFDDYRSMWRLMLAASPYAQKEPKE